MTAPQLGPVHLDRAVGTLMGAAAGDALGAGYEFQTPGPDHAEMVGGGPFGWAPGQWTDDTSMAVCIAEVTAAGVVDLDAVGEGFLRWYRSNPPDVGSTTRAALAGAASGAELAARARDAFERRPTRVGGNGSLMRTAPVALALLGDDTALVETAMAVSALTHGDPVAGEACAIWCVAIDRAVREGRFGGWWDGVDLLPDPAARDRWRAWLEAAERDDAATFRPNGYVVTALQAAVSAIISTPEPATGPPCTHLQAALRRAVSIGDDTDTVAAIAGAVLGARWGASAVPFTWGRLLHGWPGLRAHDLGRLALRTALRGGTDGMGWPGAAWLRPAYEAKYHLPGTIVPLAGDPGLLLGDVRGLGRLPADVDAVLSLCRIGRDDVPAGVEHHESWLIDVEDPAGNPNLAFLLEDLAAAIGTLRSEGKRVYLHCVHAQRRTPAVAAAYLARRDGIAGLAAFERVRASLPGARLNPVFGAALHAEWP